MVKWDVGGIQSVLVKEGTLWLLELNSTEECWEQMQLTLTCAFGLSHRWTEKPGCWDSYFHSYLVERFSQGTLILHGQQGKGLRSNKVCRQCSASIGYRNRVVCNEGVRPKGHAGTSTYCVMIFEGFQFCIWRKLTFPSVSHVPWMMMVTCTFDSYNNNNVE